MAQFQSNFGAPRHNRAYVKATMRILLGTLLISMIRDVRFKPLNDKLIKPGLGIYRVNT